MAKSLKEEKEVKGKYSNSSESHMHIDQLTSLVISICIKIHTKLGPGCFERVYEEVLYYELVRAGIKVQRQLLMPIEYEELQIQNACKLDLLVDDKLIV